MYDMIIIGSGPAGLAAAIYAARAELGFVVIEQSSVSGGQVLQTYEVDNYPGIPGVSGHDLSERMRAHCDKLGVRFINEEVRTVIKQDDIFRVTTWEKNVYEARTVIAATGASHSTLDVPGEEAFAGMGVSYCATCDGAFFKDGTCAVVGGGDVAVEDAIYLSKLCRKVYLIHRRDQFRAAGTLVSEAQRKDNIEFVTNTVVRSIQGGSKVEKLEIENKETGQISELPCDGVFIAVGIRPASGLFTELAVTNEGGYLIAGETCETTCRGLYAAGDVRAKQLRQIITAAADGANAVTSALKIL